MQAELQEQVRSTIFGDHISESNAALLLAESKQIRLKPGDYLFREGEQDDRIYLLLEGQIDLTMAVPGRGELPILSLGTGELIAWSSLLGDGIMTCSAICKQPAYLVVIECEAAREMMQHDKTVGYELMKMMGTALAKRLLATRLQLLDLFASR